MKLYVGVLKMVYMSYTERLCEVMSSIAVPGVLSARRSI